MRAENTLSDIKKQSQLIDKNLLFKKSETVFLFIERLGSFPD
jgi:hypothetical protein